MRESLLYRIHSYGMDPKIAPLKLYEEVFTSKYKMVRIWKVLDVAERYEPPRVAGRPGEYAPALKSILEKKRDFKLAF